VAGRVVVVGAVNVDMVVTAERLPGPGETVVGPGVVRHGGGKGANAAVAAARVGAAVTLVGAVGADDTGRGALDELRAEGVSVDGVAVLDEVATGVALIVVDPVGENQIAVGAGANARVGELPDGILDGAGCVLVSTEVPDAAVLSAVRAAAAAGVPCVLNPAPVTAAVRELVGSAAVLTPNRSELADLAGGSGPDSAAALRARHGAPVVVTLGREGALVVDGSPALVAAPPVPAVDTTGAGDAFNGVLAAQLADGVPLADAVRAAVTVASLVVQHPGARPAF
jgi:ribokinase